MSEVLNGTFNIHHAIRCFLFELRGKEASEAPDGILDFAELADFRGVATSSYGMSAEMALDFLVFPEVLPAALLEKLRSYGNPVSEVQQNESAAVDAEPVGSKSDAPAPVLSEGVSSEPSDEGTGEALPGSEEVESTTEGEEVVEPVEEVPSNASEASDAPEENTPSDESTPNEESEEQ